MIGLVIVTHGQLAQELVAATEHVVGSLAACVAVSIGADDDMEQRRDDIRAAIQSADAGEGVIIVTDIFGGTPSNLAMSLLSENRVEVIAGANLPMMITLAEARGRMGLADLASNASSAGRRYITVGSHLIDGLS